MGLGSAYMDGLALVRGDLVVLMDADLSHHPKFIPALYRCVLVRGVLGGSGDEISRRRDKMRGKRDQLSLFYLIS